MRVAIIGNSGSGKSTLAGQLSAGLMVHTLDLDTIVWEPAQIAVPRDVDLALSDLRTFCESREHWIVEGCYGNLIEASLAYGPELIFLNPGLAQCLLNCRTRPWQEGKYSSKQEQDSKLAYLLQWVTDYYTRDGDMSLAAHEDLFERYRGPKRMLTELPSVGVLQ
jgi:adenylate kinase family enzyme